MLTQARRRRVPHFDIEFVQLVIELDLKSATVWLLSGGHAPV